MDETDNKVHDCNSPIDHCPRGNRKAKVKKEDEGGERSQLLDGSLSQRQLHAVHTHVWLAHFQRVSAAGSPTIQQASPQTKTRVDFQKPPSWSLVGMNTAIPRRAAGTNFTRRRLHAHSSRTSEGTCVRKRICVVEMSSLLRLHLCFHEVLWSAPFLISSHLSLFLSFALSLSGGGAAVTWDEPMQ